MKRVLASAAIAAGMFGGSAFAADKDYCEQFANQAVISASQNVYHNCGYAGPEWSADYQSHYDKCLAVDMGDAVLERMQRGQRIADCIGGGGKKRKPK